MLFIGPTLPQSGVRQLPVTLDGEPIEGQNEGQPKASRPRRVGSGAWLPARTRGARLVMAATASARHTGRP